MRIHLVFGIVAACLLGAGSGHAQDKSVSVGAPPGALTRLVQHLSPLFTAETGIAVRPVALAGQTDSTAADVLLAPRRAAEDGEGQRVVFYGEAVLVGSRADRARVRGLKDIKTAFQWIAGARALYVSSSPALGLRDLELKLWEEIGVNVKGGANWYNPVNGDEDAVFSKAAQYGAYALVQRATWAAQDDRRGLEIVAEGDPALRTAYVSRLLRSTSPEARAWHDWLASEQGEAAISGWRLSGLQIFTPAREGDAATRPRT
jgi:tungstate transport system substrate-binding protein